MTSGRFTCPSQRLILGSKPPTSPGNVVMEKSNSFPFPSCTRKLPTRIEDAFPGNQCLGVSQVGYLLAVGTGGGGNAGITARIFFFPARAMMEPRKLVKDSISALISWASAIKGKSQVSCSFLKIAKSAVLGFSLCTLSVKRIQSKFLPSIFFTCSTCFRVS